MITMSQYRRACYIVDRLDAGDAFARFLYPKKQGRRPAVSPRTLLIGFFLTAQHRHTLIYQDVFELLTRDLPAEAMIELGVAVEGVADDGRPIAELTLERHHLYSLTRRLRELCGGATGEPITPEVKQVLLDVANRLVAAPLPTRPKGSGAYCVDETDVKVWSRGRKKTTADKAIDHMEPTEDSPSVEIIRRSVNPDANWGGKTGKNGKSEMYFGFSMHGLVRAPAIGASYEDEPYLLERFDLTPASTDVVDATLALLDHVAADGLLITELIGDRHYSYKKAKRWSFELLKRGIEQVVDLNPNQHGFTDAGGTRVAAGVPHCPATPDNLGTITRPGPESPEPKTLVGADAHKAQVDERNGRMNAFVDLIELRQKFALVRHTRPTADKPAGRYQCPALAGQIGCPLREGTVPAARSAGLPVVENPPELATAPKCCTQSTVTLKLEDTQPKAYQAEYWGSPQWQESYGRRNHVESYFGLAKDKRGGGLDQAAFRGDCLGLYILYLGIVNAITNLQKLRTWHEKSQNRLDLDEVLICPDEPAIRYLEQPDRLSLVQPDLDAA